MTRRRIRTVSRNALGLAVVAVGLTVPTLLAQAPPAAAAAPPEVMLVQPATLNGCLAADPADPAVVRLRQCAPDASFHWVHEWDGRLRNLDADRCLGAAAAQNATPRLEPCSSTTARWDTKARGGGYDSFRVRGTDLCVDFPASIAVGDLPRLRNCQSDTHHDWAVFRLEDKPQLVGDGIVVYCGGRTIAEWQGGGPNFTVRTQGTDNNEVICGTVRGDTITGQGGRDRIFGGFGDDDIDGGGDDDVIWSHAGNDSVRGGAGNDDVNGGLGADELRGGVGDDVLVGSANDDEIHGEDGRDKLIGFGGSDDLHGGAGYDSLCDTDGNPDEYDGGTSTDPELAGAQHIDHAYFDYPLDTLTNIEIPDNGDHSVDPIEEGYASVTGAPNISCFVPMGLATGISDALSIEDTTNFANPNYGEPGPSTRQLTIERVGPGAVTATSTGSPSIDLDCTAPTDPCSASAGYESGVTLTVSPTPGSGFVGWSGLPCTSPTPNVCQLVMTSDLTVTATFEPTKHKATVARTGPGSGRVTATQDGEPVADFACAGTPTGACTGTVSYGAEVELTATQDLYHTFVRWEGPFACAAGATEPVCRFTVDDPADLTMIARFGLSKRVIGVDIPESDGSGTVQAVGSGGDPVPGFECEEDRDKVICGVEVDYGTHVTFTSTPDAGSGPASWSGAPCEGDSPAHACTIAAVGPDVAKLGPDITVVATFGPAVYRTVTRTISGKGSVTAVDASGHDPLASCTPTAASCSAEVLNGESLTFTAAPASGATFGGWSGPCAPGTASAVCEVVIDGDVEVTATFRTANPLSGLLDGLNGLLGLLGGLFGKS